MPEALKKNRFKIIAISGSQDQKYDIYLKCTISLSRSAKGNLSKINTFVTECFALYD